MINPIYFNIILLLFGTLMASIISGLSNKVIPASLLIYVICFLFIAFSTLKGRKLNFPKLKIIDILLLFFFLSIVFSIFHHEQGSASPQKTISLIYLIISPVLLLYISFLFIKTIDVKKVLSGARILTIISVIISLILFFTSLSSVEHTGKKTIIGVENSIWFGRYLGLSLLVLLLSDTAKNRTFTIVFSIIVFYLLLASGSRGALVSLIFASLFFKLPVPPKYIIFSLFLLLLLPILMELSTVSDYFLLKEDFSNYRRISLYLTSFELIKNNFFSGIGFGNFGIYLGFPHDPTPHYPHNILVEIFVECGIFSFTAFFLIINMVFKIKNTSRSFTSIFVYAFINSLFSGDINGNASLFVALFFLRFISDKQIINDSPDPKPFIPKFSFSNR